MFRMGQEEKDAVARVIDSKQLFKVNGGPLKECANFEKEMRVAGQQRIDVFDNRMYFVNLDGTWYLADMLSLAGTH